MFTVLSPEQSWWLSMADAFNAIGQLYLISNMTEEQLRQYIFDSLKPRFDSYFLKDQDGDIVLLSKGGYDMVMEIGWDEYDAYCTQISGYDRRKEKRRGKARS